jgi:uncharacterized membrane protein YphA (DoxX/SURF4 family)
MDSFLSKLASPFTGLAHWLLRLGLGIDFFLHGYGKLPISEGFINWLGLQGVYSPEIIAYAVAWGEMLAGIGIILGGILPNISVSLGNVVTRLSGGTIGVIMIGALYVAHSNWNIFFGERGAVLFASEQLFLLILGIYFAIKGNQN